MVLSFANFLSPGVRLVENTAGKRVKEIASHSTTYMIGSGASGAYNTPVQVTSLTDFTNQFGSSPSQASVKLFFRNNQNAILFFIRAGIAARNTLTVTTAAAGAYTATINGTACTYTAIAGDTKDIIVAGLISVINLNVGSTVTAVAGSAVDQLVVYADVPNTPFTLTSSANITAVAATPATPTSYDYVNAIQSFSDQDDNLAQGFLIAPQAFQLLTLASDRLAVGNAMQALCSSEGYDWVALVDCAQASDTVAKIQTDATQYTTSKGHLAFFAPYVTDLEDGVVPPSSALAAGASRKFEIKGFQEPLGGTEYPILGVKNVVVKLGRSQQDVLNPIGANIIRNLRNKGIVLYGMRTRSTDPLYNKINVRVIMNVLNGSLRTAFDQFPFSTIDSKGVLLHRIEETAISTCRRLYNSNALFGASETDAFEVRCNFANNSSDELESGNVLLQVYAAPVPGLEKLLIATYRVGIGQVQASASEGSVQT